MAKHPYTSDWCLSKPKEIQTDTDEHLNSGITSLLEGVNWDNKLVFKDEADNGSEPYNDNIILSNFNHTISANDIGQQLQNPGLTAKQCIKKWRPAWVIYDQCLGSVKDGMGQTHFPETNHGWIENIWKPQIFPEQILPERSVGVVRDHRSLRSNESCHTSSIRMFKSQFHRESKRKVQTIPAQSTITSLKHTVEDYLQNGELRYLVGRDF